MISGWIKVSRRITKHWLWKDPVKLYWWLDLLIYANWEDKTELVGNKLVTVKRGQMLTTMPQLALRWKVSVDSVRKFIRTLQDEGQVDYCSSTRGSILTICNYETYQCSPKAISQPITSSDTDSYKGDTKAIVKVTDKAISQSINKVICQPITDTDTDSCKDTTKAIAKAKTKAINKAINKEINNNINNNIHTQQTRANYKNENEQEESQQVAQSHYEPTQHTTLQAVCNEYRNELGTETETSNAALRTAKNFCGRVLSREDLVKLLDIFNDLQVAKGETHATHGDYRRHFLSWLPYQLKSNNNGLSVQHQPSRRSVTRSTEQPGADF